MIPLVGAKHYPSSIAVLNETDSSFISEETAIPYSVMKEAGFDIKFATQNGKAPQCDKRMLEGITQKLLVSD
jgi:hypothetical protein